MRGQIPVTAGYDKYVRWALLIGGVALMVYMIWNSALRDETQSTTVTEVAKVESMPSPEASLTGEPGPGEAVTTPSRTVETTERTTRTDVPVEGLSETASLAIFGMGVVLLLAGAFFERIKSIEGPWGKIILQDAKEKVQEVKKDLEALKRRIGDPTLAKDAELLGEIDGVVEKARLAQERIAYFIEKH